MILRLCDCCGNRVMERFTWVLRASDGAEEHTLCEACSIKVQDFIVAKKRLQ